jgi:hypothetical protein
MQCPWPVVDRRLFGDFSAALSLFPRSLECPKSLKFLKYVAPLIPNPAKW